ncbi:MAG: hypothetical protein ACPL6D_15675 [Thermodesulfobacteriota bacterium]
MKKIVLLISLLTLVAFASAGLAQQAKTPQTPAPAKPSVTPEPTKPVKTEKFSGGIAKVDETAKSIVVKSKKVEKTFVTDENTKITKGKETLTFADLKQGMNVSVEYKKDGDKLVALAIKVAVPKAPPKKMETKKEEEPKK